MQVISMMRANTQAEQPVMNDANNRPISQVDAQKPMENAASAENVSHKKEAENSSSQQKDFAKMVDEQAQKQETQAASQKEEKPVPVKKMGKKMREDVGSLLKDDSAKKLLVSGKKNTDQKAAVLEAEGQKDKKKTKNAQLEQLHLAQANEEEKDEISAEDEFNNKSPLVAMALNVAKKEIKEANEEAKNAVKAVSEADKKDSKEASNIHKVSFEQKIGDETLMKEASLEMKASEGNEKADIKNIDLKDNISLEDQSKSEPIVLVTDRRSQADLAEGKPIEPTTLIRQALKESGNNEIVQRAQFILRDQAAGEIRLTLKPESLGTVRINLTLDDHRVLGRIVVDNAEVKAAFDENMGDLRERMQRGGFTMGQLDVSVGQRRDDEGFQQHNAHSEAPFYSERHREGNRVFNQIQDTPRADSYRSVLVNMQA